MRPPAISFPLILALAFASSPGGADAQERISASLVMPVTGLVGGEVRECGVRAVANWGSRAVTVDIALVREAIGADLVVRAYGSGADGGISSVAIEARGVAAPDFPSPPRTILFGIEQRTSAASQIVSDFLQSLMLTGATLVLRRDGQGESRIDIDGPLSHSVRAAYLNCAGDLYRPSE